MGVIPITVIMAVLILLDQLSKLFAIYTIKPAGQLDFIPHILNLVYLENTGAAFSMFDGARIFLLLFTGAVLVVASIALYRDLLQDKFANICLLFIVAGGWGNFIDRLFRGYVVDYFNCLFIDFPVFNVADCYVTCGVIVLIVYMLFFNRDLLKDEKHD